MRHLSSAATTPSWWAAVGLPAAVVWVALVALPCSAQARSALMVPLGELGIETREVRRVQSWLARAAKRLPRYRWLASSRWSRWLRRPQHIDCLAEKRCIRRLAARSGADLVVAGDVGSIGGAYVVYLRAIDSSGREIRSAQGLLDPREDKIGAARALLYRLLLPASYVGSIKVTVDVPNAWIYLDGRRVARGPRATIEGVPVGPHALRVTQESYRDFVRFVRVEFEGTATVEAKLSAYRVRTQEVTVNAADKQVLSGSDLPWYRRWWAVTAFGAALLATTTTVVALFPRSVGRDKEVTVVAP